MGVLWGQNKKYHSVPIHTNISNPKNTLPKYYCTANRKLESMLFRKQKSLKVTPFNINKSVRFSSRPIQRV